MFEKKVTSNKMRNQAPFELLHKYQSSGPIIAVASTDNCSLIVIGSVDKRVTLLNKFGKKYWEIKLENEVWAVDIAKNGNFIVAGTANKLPADGSIYIFNRHGEKIWHQHIGSPVWDVSISENGATLAVSCWDNKAYRFIKTASGYMLDKKIELGKFGLYGISLSKDGSNCAVAAYDEGVFILNNEWKIKRKFKGNAKTGLYRLKLGNNDQSIIVGCRNGCYLLIEDIWSNIIKLSTCLSKRPICGIACSFDLNAIALGSFDGTLILTSKNGYCIWKYELGSEIWSISISNDGSTICVAAGDGKLYIFNNLCTSSVISEIESIEKFLELSNADDLKRSLNDIISLYLRYGIIEYGIKRIWDICSVKLSEESINKKIIELINAYLIDHPTNFDLHFSLANYYNKINNKKLAIFHYQIASNDLKQSSKSLYSQGELFSELHFNSAARSCYRRAIQQSLDNVSKNILFNLARSYEDNKCWEEAAILYEILISSDIFFRSSWDRLENIREKTQKEFPIDQTGITVNLAGVDAPKENNLDSTLKYILSSREKELYLNNKDTATLIKIFATIEDSNSSEIGRDYKQLDYNEIAYLKYDNLPADDEIKKRLEMIYELLVINQRPKITYSLDIGAATGRHPTILAKRGIKSIGVDIEPVSMHYAQKMKNKNNPTMDYPIYLIGNAVALSFHNNIFELVTCMMGTFAHFPSNKRDLIIEEIWRILKPGGLLLISTWDIECEHLSYLSIYEQAQKDFIKGNSLSKHETKILLENHNFKIIRDVSFMFLPNVLTYELNVDKLTMQDIKRMVIIDNTCRSLYPDMHGEMFMICAEKINKV